MRIIIVGAGDVGFQLGRRLSRDHHDITVIDANPDKVRRAADQLDGLAVEGQGDSYRVLLQAGIRETDVLAAVTDNDDANLMACRLAKASGVEVTIARVRNGEFTEPDFPLTTEQLGVDHIIHPEREAANAILRPASSMSTSGFAPAAKAACSRACICCGVTMGQRVFRQREGTRKKGGCRQGAFVGGSG